MIGGGVTDASEVDVSNADPLVEVSYNGETVVVPQSQTAIDPNTGEPYFASVHARGDSGLEWMLSSATVIAPPKRNLRTIGVPDNLRGHMHSLDVEASRCMPPDDPRYRELPQRFTKAYPLDNPAAQRGTGGSFGYPSTLYKCLDQYDGHLYCVRRFENVRANPAVINSALDTWAKYRHPAVVSLYNITHERGAVFFTHSYHPAATTLQQRFLDVPGPLLQTGLLWRIATQLLIGMRDVHRRGMALRMVHLTLTLTLTLTPTTFLRFSPLPHRTVRSPVPRLSLTLTLTPPPHRCSQHTSSSPVARASDITVWALWRCWSSSRAKPCPSSSRKIWCVWDSRFCLWPLACTSHSSTRPSSVTPPRYWRLRRRPTSPDSSNCSSRHRRRRRHP